MTKAKSGSNVKINFVGKLEDGTVFDSSDKSKPIEFNVGKGQIIKGLEEAVIGMNSGDKKTVKIPPEKAFGPRRQEAVIDVPRSQIPQNIDPKVGLQLQIKQPTGQSGIVTITDVKASTVKLDANHPLAGKTLVFEIELVGVA